jgi:cytochrome c oxidase subunit 2
VTGSPRRSLWIAGIALVVALLAVAGVLVVGASRHGGSAASRGEVIFQTGRDASGALIPRSGSATNGGGMMGGGGMMRVSCASCHGSDGRGRATMMFTAPDITYGNLTDPKGMLQPDGTRGPTYTDTILRTAVTTGLDPTGAHLAAPMPQWQLTDSRWGDLLAYLKTLR